MTTSSQPRDVKPGYKRTDVGVIPDDWDVRAVKEMGQVITGKALAVNGPGKQRPYLRTRNVFDGSIDISDVLSMPMTDEQFAQFRAEPGDVLLNEGQSLELVGRCAMYSGEYVEPCAIQNQLLRFRAKDGVCGVFASHLFRYSQQTGVFARIALQTTSIAHLGGSRFERLRLAWPRTEQEQKAIAEALSDADALLGSLDRLIAKKRDLKQAAMQQLLSGRTRLPGFHAQWPETTLGEIGECVIGLTYTPANVVEHGLLVLRSSNIQNNRLAFDDNVHVNVSVPEHLLTRTGDILVCVRNGSRALIGKCAVIDKSAVGLTFGAFMSVYRTPHWRFIAHAFKSDTIQRQIRDNMGATINQITNKDMKSFRVKLPDDAEQYSIAEVLTDMDAELVTLERQREKTRAIKQAMMQELLTGRIRLAVEPTNLVLFPLEQLVTPPAAKPHNWQINEAVVIAVLVRHFGSEEFPLGRKRYTKLSYLLHRHVERAASGYLKKAAGPYNPSTKYKGPEGIAQRKQYIRTHTRGQFVGFVAADKISEAEGYFQKWYGDDVLRWLEQFRRKTNDQLELLATVDMAMEDLRKTGTTPTLDGVKGIIEGDREWKAKLGRAVFSDANIAVAMKTCAGMFCSELTTS